MKIFGKAENNSGVVKYFFSQLKSFKSVKICVRFKGN